MKNKLIGEAIRTDHIGVINVHTMNLILMQRPQQTNIDAIQVLRRAQIFLHFLLMLWNLQSLR